MAPPIGARGTAQQTTTDPQPTDNRRPHDPRPNRRSYAASLALLAYMSTYSCPDSRMTSAITESVTARST